MHRGSASVPIATLKTNNGNQRQTQGVEPSQNSMQCCLVKGPSQGREGLVFHPGLDLEGHTLDEICPSGIQLAGHLDLIADRSVQSELVLDLAHVSTL